MGFSELQWEAIDAKLAADPARFGCPIRRDKSVVVGSFNALKLGNASDSAKRWAFLARFCSRYDLLAVQEVMDQLDGVRRLKDALGPSFELLISDTTGAFPGMRGLKERLAFFYRPSRINLTELAADITYDRSHIVAQLRENIDIWKEFFAGIDEINAQRQQEGRKKKSLSEFAHPAFSTFIRTPHCATFTVRARDGAEPLEFLAVNAHTLYGKGRDERNREFEALLDWVIQRTKSSDRMYFRNIILLADLNLYFDDPQTKLSEVIRRLIDLESTLLTGQSAARANFPFLAVHPGEMTLFSTNARKDQAFDHVALFIDKDETRLPSAGANARAGREGRNGYDYGVFDFVELFSQSIHGKPFMALPRSRQNALLKCAQEDVSDHMPIWLRLPIPGA